jgi:hypothetical protein
VAEIPEEDRKKAEVFFTQGKKVGDAGQYEFAISMYLEGLERDPENVAAHQAMRDISMKRKASGGKPLGMMERMKTMKQSKDEKQNLLSAEKLLAYDPGNLDYMTSMMQAAQRAEFYDTVLWIGSILMQANLENPKKPDFKTFIILKDTYKALGKWKLATQAAQGAVALKPDDMDLQTELKHLGAQDTMTEGKYEDGGSFTGSMRDMKGQLKLIEQEKDVKNVDVMQQMIEDAEAQWKAEPNEPGKLMKLVDALTKTEKTENENRAIELLEAEHKRTGQFRFRQSIGKIKLAQLSRMERAMRADAEANRKDEEKVKAYHQFIKEKRQEELSEYLLWAENYPTDMSFKFQAAVRMFQLDQFDQAIPILQLARMDPKYKNEASIYLGRAFLEAGFVDEAVDTLKSVIDEYLARGDDRSRMMTYWYARALESKGESDPAIKAYSQLAQWDFNYRDVQKRIKELRDKRKAAQAPEEKK